MAITLLCLALATPILANVWPLPASMSSGTDTLAVMPSMSFFTSSSTSPFLDQAFARYTQLCFAHRTKPSLTAAGLSGLVVNVDSTDDSHPQLETDETYSLDVSGAGATLSAKTVYGALRGLETFSQLLNFDFDTESYTIPNGPWKINDEPRFPHRGLMMDTSRHFQPLSSIKHMIDSLPYAKLNVLHWHMSDTQSFPLQINSHPKLWDGAFSQDERYIQDDVADVVEYARLRGVRVFVEFDMPGHAASWCAGYPDICPSAACTQPLNVANDDTFSLIEDLMMEMTGGAASTPGAPSKGLFKDNMIHLGGDEVNTDCWSKTPAIQKWMDDKGFTADQAYAYFVDKVAKIAVAQGHRPVQWSEVFDHFHGDLDKSTIVHIWKGVTNVTEVVDLGYQVLLNVGYNNISWYLDNLNIKWDAVYQNEPCNGVPDDLCHFIIGGHGEMWGETVDASNFEQTVWPKLAAIAERLWSPRDTTDLDSAHDRIQKFRCFLNRRGIRAAPVNNDNARSAPPHPGSCFTQ